MTRLIIITSALIISLGFNIYLMLFDKTDIKSYSNSRKESIFETEYYPEWLSFIQDYDVLRPEMREYYFKNNRSIALVSEVSITPHNKVKLWNIELKLIVPIDLDNISCSIELANNKIYEPNQITKGNTTNNKVKTLSFHFLVEEDTITGNSLYANLLGCKEQVINYPAIHFAITELTKAGRRGEFSMYSL